MGVGRPLKVVFHSISMRAPGNPKIIPGARVEGKSRHFFEKLHKSLRPVPTDLDPYCDAPISGMGVGKLLKVVFMQFQCVHLVTQKWALCRFSSLVQHRIFSDFF